MKKAKDIRLAFLLDDFSSEYGVANCMGALQAAKDLGISIVFFGVGALGNPTLFYGMRNNLLSLLVPEDFNGIVFQSSCISNFIGQDQFLEFIKRYNSIPAAHIGITAPKSKCFNINNASGMYELVSHMIKIHGRKKIAFIGGPPQVHDAQERLQAYKDALKDNGIPFDDRYIYDGNFLRDSGILAVEYFLDNRKIEIDCLIGANDPMAVYAMKELQKRGYRIPEDISIGGFDNLSSAQSHQPTLTTVHQPIVELGYQAVYDLAQDLLNETVSSGDFSFPAQLVVRNSCGCTNQNPNPLEIIKTLPPSNKSLYEYEELNLILNMIARNIIGTFEESEIRDVLDESLRILDIENFTLSKYIDSNHSVIFYDTQKKIGEKIPSNHLIPKKLDSLPTPFYKFVMPLFFREEDIGFFVCDSGSKALYSLETLRDHLSGALKGSGLLQEARQDAKKLEQKVKERTFELAQRSKELEIALKDIKLAGKKLERLAVIDELTGLYNRRGFMTVSKQHLELQKRKKSDLLLVFFDLDGLKYINDNFGHTSGDIAIKALAEILLKVFRKSDIISRLGGDEFTVLAFDCTFKKYDTIIKRMNHLIDEYNLSNKNDFELSVSSGAAQCKSVEEDTIEDLINRADAELYKVKREKKKKNNEKSE